MEHVTACYWQKETPAELFLSLQQRKYRRLGISVVCACISDNGELVRSLQNKMEEELEGENVWRPFREEILQEKWMDIIRQQKQDDSFSFPCPPCFAFSFTDSADIPSSAFR